jgi:hypothetical protein
MSVYAACTAAIFTVVIVVRPVLWSRPAPGSRQMQGDARQKSPSDSPAPVPRSAPHQPHISRTRHPAGSHSAVTGKGLRGRLWSGMPMYDY